MLHTWAVVAARFGGAHHLVINEACRRITVVA